MFKIEKTLNSPTIPRTIRFTKELFSRLQETAKANHVSFNRVVLECCKYALDNQEETEK